MAGTGTHILLESVDGVDVFVDHPYGDLITTVRHSFPDASMVYLDTVSGYLRVAARGAHTQFDQLHLAAYPAKIVQGVRRHGLVEAELPVTSADEVQGEAARSFRLPQRQPALSVGEVTV